MQFVTGVFEVTTYSITKQCEIKKRHYRNSSSVKWLTDSTSIQ